MFRLRLCPSRGFICCAASSPGSFGSVRLTCRPARCLALHCCLSQPSGDPSDVPLCACDVLLCSGVGQGVLCSALPVRSALAAPPRAPYVFGEAGSGRSASFPVTSSSAAGTLAVGVSAVVSVPCGGGVSTVSAWWIEDVLLRRGISLAVPVSRCSLSTYASSTGWGSHVLLHRASGVSSPSLRHSSSSWG